MEPTLQQRLDALRATGDLPTPTGVALKVIELAQRDDVSAAEVARAVGTDPALTARLLRLANSPNVRRHRPAVAIGDAVVLLGLHVVRQLALGLSVLDAHRRGACSGFDYDRFWARSLATAVAAEAVCARLGGTAPEEAFTCGLLARVGGLALATVYPEDYGPMVAHHGGLPADGLRAAERERFGIDHLALSQAMLSEWSLPAVQVGAVAGLYDPRQCGDATSLRGRRLAHALNASAALAELMGDTPQPDSMARATAALEAAGLEADDAAELYDAAASEWREWAKLLEVDAEGPPDFATLQEALRSRPARPREGAGDDEGPALRVLMLTAGPQDACSGLLEAAGHAVACTASAREALRGVIEGEADVLAIDARDASDQALSLCRAVRRTERGRYCYLLVLVAGHDRALECGLLEAGADDCVDADAPPAVLAARLRPAGRLVALRNELEHEREQTRRYVGELAIANRRLEQAALTDALTGLPNRRHAMRRLAQVIAAARRHQRPVACMLVDLDHFKAVNDTWGHAAGDEVLRAVAERLRASARSEDEVCRIGGEEFLIVCAETTAEAARRTAQRVREAMAERPVTAGEIELPLTASIGVAVSRAGATTPERLLEVADRALYQAKRAGRDRISVLAVEGNGSGAPRTSPA